MVARRQRRQFALTDIVTTDEDDTSFSVELDGFDYSYPS
jgi:hypothetical protein